MSFLSSCTILVKIMRHEEKEIYRMLVIWSYVVAFFFRRAVTVVVCPVARDAIGG